METALLIITIGEKILPFLMKGITLVEEAFAGQSESGADKKSIVMMLAEVSFKKVLSITDETKWEGIKPHVGKIIDECVEIMKLLK